jgi:acetyltransferase
MRAAIAPGPYRIHRYPSALIDRVVLDDGRSVTVRPVLPQDVDAEQAFVGALTPLSRRRRFHLGVAALPDDLLRRFTEVDFRSHVALVAEARRRDDEPVLVADARYVVLDDRAAAEFAVVIADAWQGVGLGRELLRRLARHALRDRIRTFEGEVLADNAPMLALVASLGGRVIGGSDEPGVVRVEIDLRRGRPPVDAGLDLGREQPPVSGDLDRVRSPAAMSA